MWIALTFYKFDTFLFPLKIQKPIQPSISNATVLHVPRTVATNAQGVRQVLPANLQQIHVPGNKFHYIRLANPSSSTGSYCFTNDLSIAVQHWPSDKSICFLAHLRTMSSS
jgi:hypothetical protein